MAGSDRTALFVRLSADQAGRLERAVAAVPARKKDLIGGLLERHVDPDSEEGIEALREIARAGAPAPRFLGEERERPVVGHHAFTPAPRPEVLDAAGAAELLAVEQPAIVTLAERGELPGRRIGGEWRFSRSALLAWLGNS
jgi:excisionase family DNA binding protein